MRRGSIKNDVRAVAALRMFVFGAPWDSRWSGSEAMVVAGLVLSVPGDAGRCEIAGLSRHGRRDAVLAE